MKWIKKNWAWSLGALFGAGLNIYTLLTFGEGAIWADILGTDLGMALFVCCLFGMFKK